MRMGVLCYESVAGRLSSRSCLFPAFSKEVQHIQRDRFRPDLPLHGDDLPAVIGAVIDQMLHQLHQRVGIRHPGHVAELQSRVKNILVQTAKELLPLLFDGVCERLQLRQRREFLQGWYSARRQSAPRSGIPTLKELSTLSELKSF